MVNWYYMTLLTVWRIHNNYLFGHYLNASLFAVEMDRNVRLSFTDWNISKDLV